MNWLARLKWENFSPCTPCEALPKLPKAPFDSKDSAPHGAHGENSRGEAAPAWILHFPDADPLEVHFIPCASDAEVLEAYPAAVAAEPIEEPAAKSHKLPPGDERAIRRWLACIGETDEITIIEILAGCATNEEALEYFLWRAQEVGP